MAAEAKKVDMNELSRQICGDVGGELKASCKPCPSTFIKVYKSYYTKATFKACCKFEGEPNLELMQHAFAGHCYFVLFIFIFTLILRAAILGLSAGAVSLFAGIAGGWAVQTFIMESDFQIIWRNALSVVGAGILISLLAGLAFAARPLAASPAQVLRARE